MGWSKLESFSLLQMQPRKRSYISKVLRLKHVLRTKKSGSGKESEGDSTDHLEEL